MRRGVGENLRAVLGDVLQLDQAQSPGQANHLREQGHQRLKVPFAEGAEGAEVGVLVGGEHPEGAILVGLPGDDPRANHAWRVGGEQERGEHHGMVGRVATTVALVVDRGDRRQVQLADDVADQGHRVVRRQPLTQVSWQRQWLVRIGGAEHTRGHQQPQVGILSIPLMYTRIPTSTQTDS